MKDVIQVISAMQKHRANVPQFLFNSSVYLTTTIAVREKITEYFEGGGTKDEIDFIVNSPGGLADDAYRIIRTLRKAFKQVNIIIPFWAKSAATLLSLGASRIVMDEFAEFGPLDVQLGKVRDDSPEILRESALNDEHSLKRIETRFKEMFETLYIRIYEHKKINIPKSELTQQLFENLSKFYEPLLKQIDPYKLGDKRRKLDIGSHYARRILIQFGGVTDLNKVRELVDFLVDGCPDHAYIIDYDIIKHLLDYVVTSEDAFGKAYAKELSKLSMLFLTQDIQDFIGFIAPAAVAAPVAKPTAGKAKVKPAMKSPGNSGKSAKELKRA